MENLKRKGFTIVELVIVIAVIAVLAAVLIPTFVSLTKKANLSVDQQAVRQMNTMISIEASDKKMDSLNDVYSAFAANGYNVESYIPMTEDTRFVWIKDINTIVHVDKNNKILYPTNLGNLQYEEGNWFDLNNLLASDPNRLYLDDIPATADLKYDGKEPLPEGIEPTLYTFRPMDDNSEKYAVQREKYKNWIADFAIILNDDFADGSAGICGQYFELDWVSMTVPGDQVAGTCFLLMADGFENKFIITYESLVSICAPTNGKREGFHCGAYNLNPENVGKSITVQLRLYETEKSDNEYVKTGKYVVCQEVVYTFNK